ncbi:MAG: hypothetical protein EOM50_04390 [Erysipelotrichia bacterium]|nr:hypothetical protein [Erysipelotrichia bacterium]NCC54581.1 hypothetical protein [Erysipelotrichia bacterium]
MRYPLLYVNKLPVHYKHCMQVKAIHFYFDRTSSFTKTENSLMKEEYLEQLKQEMLKAINAQFIHAQGEVIDSKGKTFMVFKSNFDDKMFTLLINNLFAEVDEYVEGSLEYYYGIYDAMLYLEGREPSLLGSMRMGKELLGSDEYTKQIKKADLSKTKGHAKYLTSFEEFSSTYLSQADNYCI